ncbi:MAG: NAD(P)H-dependent oxidoreductase subunit E [Candidatus Izemoplasmatales bacterium]
MKINEILMKYPREEDLLIEVLLEVQRNKETHHLERGDLLAVAEHLNLPESRVSSVVSFYSFFSTAPRGKYIIQYCRDLPCHLSDDFNLKETLKSLLSIDVGETTEDGLFTLEYTSCLGSCDQSPVIRINDEVYGLLNENKLKAIIAEYRGGNHD